MVSSCSRCLFQHFAFLSQRVWLYIEQQQLQDWGPKGIWQKLKHRVCNAMDGWQVWGLKHVEARRRDLQEVAKHTPENVALVCEETNIQRKLSKQESKRTSKT